MQISIVNYSKVKSLETFRIDAEYYHPDSLKVTNILKKKAEFFISLKEIEIKCDASAFYPALEPFYGKGSIPFIRVADVRDGIDYKRATTIPKEILTEYKTLKSGEKGDIILTKGGSIARAGIVTEYSALTRDLIFFNTSKLKEIDYIFYYIFCMTNFYKKLLLQSASMTAQPHLTTTLVKNIPFFNPRYKFKETINNYFKQHTKLIQQSNKLYKQAQDILLDELGLNNWQPKHQLSFIKKYSDVQQAERIDAEYYQPKYNELVNVIKNYAGGWDILGNIVYIKKGFEVGSAEYLDEGIPFVRVSNINTFEITEEKYISEGLYNKLTSKKNSTNDFTKSSNHQPQQGEILLTKDGTLGTAYYLREKPKKMIVASGILRLKNKTDSINNEYLTTVINSILVQEQAMRDMGGTVISHWRPEQIQDVVIPILSQEKQAQIQQKVTESFKLRQQSNQLLEFAKQAVEMAIEQDEEIAMNWLKNKTQQFDLDAC